MLERIPVVLVVEDDDKWQGRIRRFIEGLRYAVEQASTAVEALAKLYANPQCYSLVILDPSLEEGGFDREGLALLDAMRDQGITTPCVVLSGYLDPGMASELKDGSYGVSGAFSKRDFSERPAFVARGIREAIRGNPEDTGKGPNGQNRRSGGEAPKKDTVFVVYGRNDKARRALFELLRAAGLKPREWEQAVKRTGKGTPYIGEVIDAGMGIAQACVVLFTGDDLAALRIELLKAGEQAEQPMLQPRPNVILETGIALGKNPDRTIIVQIGDIREISDLLGRHVVRFDNSIEKRKKLLIRLRTAGCTVDLSGDDWMTAGSSFLDT